jgi:hypothetical protein
MLQQEPEYALMHLLRNEWQSGATTEGFNTNHISTGWFSETRKHPQITVSHVGDSLKGVTGYTAVGDTGPSAWQRGRAQVDCWVPNLDSWSSPGAAKDHRWELQQEVKRIIHANAEGLIDANGNRLLNHLGTLAARRTTDSDADPVVFRASLDIRYTYHQRPPVE